MRRLLFLVIFAAMTQASVGSANANPPPHVTSSCSVSPDGSPVTGVGLPRYHALYFYVLNADDSLRDTWSLSYTNFGTEIVTLPAADIGAFTYQFGGKQEGATGQNWVVYASCTG